MTGPIEIPWLEPLFALTMAALAFLPKRALRPASFVWLALLAGLWISGFRSPWPFIPAVGAAFLLIFGRRAGWKTTGARAFALLGGLAGAGLAFIFPLPVTPEPSGPYSVGTRTIELQAESGAGTKLVVQAWYPCIQSGSAERWLPDPELACRFPLARQKGAASRSLRDAPVATAGGPFPVIFYEHAWNGHRAENVAQIQDLASRGFVVVAIDHPGQAARIRYLDGSTINSTIPPVPDFSSEAAVSAFEREAKRLLEMREANIVRVKSALSSTETSGDLANAARWDEVGIFGFSFGGSCALRLCTKNPDFIAGANEDGLYLGEGIPAGSFLFMDSEFPAWLNSSPAPDETPEQQLVRRAENKLKEALATPLKSRVICANTTHASFTDRKFLSRLPFFTRCGSRRGTDIHNEITLTVGGFFERSLMPRVSDSTRGK